MASEQKSQLIEQTALVDSLHRELDRLEKWFRDTYGAAVERRVEIEIELQRIKSEYQRKYKLLRAEIDKQEAKEYALKR